MIPVEVKLPQLKHHERSRKDLWSEIPTSKPRHAILVRLWTFRSKGFWWAACSMIAMLSFWCTCSGVSKNPKRCFRTFQNILEVDFWCTSRLEWCWICWMMLLWDTEISWYHVVSQGSYCWLPAGHRKHVQIVGTIDWLQWFHGRFWKISIKSFQAKVLAWPVMGGEKNCHRNIAQYLQTLRLKNETRCTKSSWNTWSW